MFVPIQGGRARRPSNFRESYEATAETYRRGQVDPYAQLAAEQRQMGFRSPDPYDVAAAVAVESGRQWAPQLAGRDPCAYTDLHPDGAVFPAPDMAGRRSTQFGTYAKDFLSDEIRWTDRERTGYAPLGARDSGVVPDLDMAERNKHLSGRLIGSGSMAQRPPHDRPYLALRTPTTQQLLGANAIGSMVARVTLGMAGGSEQVREFALGGGFVANFYCGDADTVKVEIVVADTATSELQFAWLSNGMQAGNQTLYLPRRIVAAQFALLNVVPEGAYALAVRADDAAWSWTFPALAGFGIQAGAGYTGVRGSAGGGVTQGGENLVLGSQFSPTVANDIVWFLRPI